MDSIDPPQRPSSLITYSVPFILARGDIPEPLPTIEEIEDSTDIIKKGRARCIVRVRPRFVVKFGTKVDPIEGDNMNFVRQNVKVAGVRVPTVYAIYQREVTPQTNITYIIMEDVDGHSLDELWDTISTDEKRAVSNRLRELFVSLRGIPGLGYFGSVNMTKCRDDILWADEPILQDRGVLNTEAAFVQAVIDKYTIYCSHSEPHKVDYYRRVLPTALRGTNQSVFTHNDLRRKNILIREDGTMVILGWATAGWYPAYWDYTKAMHLCDWQDDWHEYIGRILEEFPNQYPWMSMLRTGLWSSRYIR
ncbi:hypothetical protein Neosp_003385 [[Neocosmospora] mangrovei]